LTELKLERKSAVIIGTLLIATFVAILNETALGVALPKIMVELNIAESTVQWLNTAFMLTMAIIIPTTGYLQSRFSRRRLFLVAMITFSVGTLLGAVSFDFLSLLIGRVVQAFGTALMFPLLFNTIMVLVPPQIRGRIMANISIVMAVAPAVGPSFSGLIMSFAPWRTIFWIVLPIAILVAVFGASKVKSEHEKTELKIDWPSVAIAAVAFGGLVYGLSSIGDEARGVALISPLVPIVIASAAMYWFVRRQNRLAKNDKALLDLNTFRSREFAISAVQLVVLCMSLFGLGLLIPIYTQNVLQLTPLETGLILLPGSLFMGLIAPVVGRLSDKYGPVTLIRPGAIIAALAFVYMTSFNTQTSGFEVFLANFVMSVGLATMFTPLFTYSVSTLEPKLYPHGTALTGAIQQIAGAAGTAIYVAIFTIASVAAATGGAVEREAQMTGAHWAFIVGTVFAIISVFVAFLMKDRKIER
jgi:DHA2 family lincomycin resistance protein-like MFS transporter